MPDTIAPVVEPRPGVDPAPAAPAAPTPDKQSTGLPEDLLRLPAIQGLLAGSPPAVSASLADFAKRPEGQLIVANKDPLMKAGMGLYRSLSGDLGVLFNRLFVSDQEIMDADKAGQLAQMAPSFDEVSQQISKSGDKHPILNPNLKTPTGMKMSPPPAIQPGPALSVPPAPPKQIAAKARNTSPGSPTSGPQPGGGRLINQILRPVI